MGSTLGLMIRGSLPSSHASQDRFGRSCGCKVRRRSLERRLGTKKVYKSANFTPTPFSLIRHNITRTATAQIFTSAIEDHELYSDQARATPPFYVSSNPSSITATLSKNKPGATTATCQDSEHHRLRSRPSARG
jgi:hypothetical protein